MELEIEEILPRRRLTGGDRTFCLALSCDESRVFTGREDGSLFSWPLEGGLGIKKTRVDGSIERLLVIDEDKLVVLTGNGSIIVLDERDLQVVASRPGAHGRGIFAGVFDDHGRILITGGLDGWTRCWEFPSLVPISASKVPKHGVLSMAILPRDDGPLLVVGNVNGIIATIVLKSLSIVSSIKAHDGPVFVLRSSLGELGREISYISAGSDGIIAGWKAGRPDRCLEIRSGQAKILDVLPLASQGGANTLWTASADGSIGTWSFPPDLNAARPEQLACLQVHERAVEQLVFSKSSRGLISIASDGSMKLLRTGLV